jgi:peptidoglycan/LPS O-acetylase OafA/YrhL
MLKNLDRALAILLSLGTVGHTVGSIGTYRHQPITLLWALCASLLIALLGAINLLRANRPHDRSLGWLGAFGTLGWLAAVVAFGIIKGALFDPRVVFFVAVSTGLVLFNIASAVQKGERMIGFDRESPRSGRV